MSGREPSPALRPWSALAEDERDRLLAGYQDAMARETATCSLELKLQRMQAWLAQRGVSITEEDIRPRRRDLKQTDTG
jgi:hypothetical protein